MSSPPDLSLGVPDPAGPGRPDPPRSAHPGAPRSTAGSALALAARSAAVAVVVALLALPLWLAVDAAQRPGVVRLAAAVVIALIAARIVGAARRHVQAQPPSTLERAARPAPVEVSIPREYRDLAEELHYARTSFGYWTRVLEPRLAALAARLPGALPVTVPPRSAPRRMLRLGPSLGALRDAIGRLEGRQ